MTSTTRLARRALAVAATLALFGVALAVVVVISHARSRVTAFEPQRFRAATAREDYDTVGVQARAAVRERALLGMPERQVRVQLGKPWQSQWRSGRHEWLVGRPTTSGAPGDKLLVSFDPTSRRVLTARIEVQMG